MASDYKICVTEINLFYILISSTSHAISSTLSSHLFHLTAQANDVSTTTAKSIAENKQNNRYGIEFHLVIFLFALAKKERKNERMGSIS